MDSTGIYDKYQVLRSDGRDEPGERHWGCALFVLDLTHDWAARAALDHYAHAVAHERPNLSQDLFDWLNELEVADEQGPFPHERP